jgi:ubiquitin C-terminal hydrolase
MYNLGNTCFKSAVLQCLIHCKPLQRYFLKDIGHHHKSCLQYRQKLLSTKKKSTSSTSAAGSSSQQKTTTGNNHDVCLACDMDRLFLSYYSSAVGKDAVSAVEEASRPLILHGSGSSTTSSHGNESSDVAANNNNNNNNEVLEKGDPLIISDLLTAAWKSGGMDYLAGYEQRDAHEFLNSFLDLMGKHTRQHRERVYASIQTARDDNPVVSMTDNNNNNNNNKTPNNGMLCYVTLFLVVTHGCYPSSV